MRDWFAKDKKEIIIDDYDDLEEAEAVELAAKYTDFAAYIRAARKTFVFPSGKKGISVEDLAKMFGTSKDYFRKILNMQKPTNKRDIIIATCGFLMRDSVETNAGLILYNMVLLNKHDPRDKVLIYLLDNEENLTVKKFNEALSEAGQNPLNLIGHKTDIRYRGKSKDVPLRIHEMRVATFMPDLIYNAVYDTIQSKYDPQKYRCTAKCILIDRERKAKCLLTADTRLGYEFKRKQQDEAETEQSFNSLEEIGRYEDGRYEDIFSLLDQKARRELSRHRETLHDTRNYGTRVGVDTVDDQFHMFAETYNYSIPELSEYYVVDRHGPEISFQVYQSSDFMRRYLGDDYATYYRRKPAEPIAEYSSIEELEEIISNANYYKDLGILKLRKRCFEELSELLYELLTKIKKRKVYITGVDYQIEFPDELCSVYGVEKEFDCEHDPMDEFIVFANKKEAVLDYEGIGPVSVTVDDLYRASELGFKDIYQICRVKKKLGSIEKILEI